MKFKVEIRTTCKVCGEKIKEKGFRSYCSKKCRDYFNNRQYKQYHADWQRNRSEKRALVPDKNKIKCLICGRYYVQVGSHVYAKHNMTAREYREHFDLERKRGVIPEWFRLIKGEDALRNGTYKNLKKGKKFWFVPGDKRAGNYKRSHVTINRLRQLHKLKVN